MKNGKMQAKDVDGAAILEIVEELRWKPWPWGDESSVYPRWVLLSDFDQRMPDVPRKVLLAKLRALQRQRKLSGCFCGCRGDIELPDHDTAKRPTS